MRRIKRRTRRALAKLAAAGIVVGTVAGLAAHTPPPQCRGTVVQDRACTPGVADPAVTDANVQHTICVPGYSASVRHVRTADRRRVLAAYGYDPKARFAGELDHLISLQLGGSNDPRNLWPQPGKIPNPKDAVENALHDAVCDGRISLTEAQVRIATDWRTALEGIAR